MKSINFERIKDIKVAHKIAKIIWPDFIEIDGSVFIKDNDPNEEVMKTYKDRSSYEWQCNMIHVFLIFDNGARLNKKRYLSEEIDRHHPDFNLGVELGKHIAFLWCQKLKMDFPQYRFRVYFCTTLVSFQRVVENQRVIIDEEIYSSQISKEEIIIYDTTC